MKTSQKGFVTLISIVIVILLIGIFWYILSRNTSTANIQVHSPVASSSNTMMPRDAMIGVWNSGGTDAGSVHLKLDSSGTFNLIEVISYTFSDFPPPVPEDKTLTYSGTWTIEEKENKTYLSLKSNTDFEFVPITNEEIESSKKWGEEFVGKRTVLLKVGPNVKNDPTFSLRFDGFLLEKENNVKILPQGEVKVCPLDGEMESIESTQYVFSFENIKNKNGKPHTRVIVKAQSRCVDGRLATTVYQYDLGTYQGTCTELSPVDKDVVGEYPEENVKARVQCLSEGMGSFIDIYEREDFIAHIADIKVAKGKDPAFKGNLRNLNMVGVTDKN